jgi:hypothetical protein
MDRICSSQEYQQASRKAIRGRCGGGPGEVVAGEEELVAIEEHGVAPRVARSRDDDEILVQGHGLRALDLSLDAARAARDVPFVKHPLAAEAPGESLVVGDVIPVRQEHGRDAPSLFEVLQQAVDRLRRSTRTLPSWPLDEIAQAPKESFDVKPQKETFSATGSGKAARPDGRPAATCPDRAVGQATSAISDRTRSVSAG